MNVFDVIEDLNKVGIDYSACVEGAVYDHINLVTGDLLAIVHGNPEYPLVLTHKKTNHEFKDTSDLLEFMMEYT